MKYEELLDIIKTREGYTLELKESINSSLGKEICAFANGQGGKIILGVKDNGVIKGITLTNQDISKIQDIARNMNPSFLVHIEQIKNIAIIYVPEGKEKPYTVNGHFYMRQGANSQQLNREEIRTLFQKENMLSFERQTKPFEHFSNIIFKQFQKKAQLEKLSKKHILKNINVITNDAINNAGILFFTKDIKPYFPTAIISCVLYSDTEQVDILDQKEFTLDLRTNLNEAQKYLISKLNTAILITGNIKHQRKLEIPEEALREAIINAIVHKDYFINSNIQVNIDPEKVEIVNPGKLLFPKEDFGKISAYRNPIIADIMQRLGEIEKIGSGIKRIKKYCREHAIRLKFETGEYFRIIFYRKNAPQNVPGNVPVNVPERRNQILLRIKENDTISMKELSDLLYVTERTIKRDIAYLKKKNLLKRVGPDKGGYWEIIEK
ncbi:MAG: RNA-binding domain-containing protein [Candidatus Woesearchaeota archaeon]